MAKDKKSTWVKSCEESSKRESEIMLMADELVGVNCSKGSIHLRRVRDEEKTAKELLQEAQEGRLQLEDEMWLELEGYIASVRLRKEEVVSIYERKNLATGLKQQYKG